MTNGEGRDWVGGEPGESDAGPEAANLSEMVNLVRRFFRGEDGIEPRLSGHLFIVDGDFLLLHRAAGAAAAHDEPPDVDWILAEVATALGNTISDVASLRPLVEVLVAIRKSMLASPLKGSIRLPADLPMAELMVQSDKYLPFDPIELFRPATPELASLLQTGKSGTAVAVLGQAAQAVLYPLGPVLREGLLALALGTTERHIVRLLELQDFVTTHDFSSLSRSSARTPSIGTLLGRLKKALPETFDPLSLYTKGVKEIVARRNSIVHREGRADSVFAQHVAVPPDQLGSLFETDDASLRESLAYLAGYCMRATLVAWRAWVPEGEVLEDAYLALTELLLAREDWLGLALVTEGLVEEIVVDEEARAITTANRLLALKHLGGVARIEADIRSWDAPAEPRWSLVKLALLDQVEEALVSLRETPALVAELRERYKVFDSLLADARVSALLDEAGEG